MTWSPIFPASGELAASSWNAINAICQSILDEDYTQHGRACQFDEHALLFAYLAMARQDSSWWDRATECLNLAIDAAPENSGYLGLHGGLCGLGWTIEHVSRLLPEDSTHEAQDAFHLPEDADEDLNEELDALILRNLDSAAGLRQYDLVSGLVGFGVYFLERWPKEIAVEGLRSIVNHLEDAAEHKAGEITWPTLGEMPPERLRKQCPPAHCNAGIAHGITGIIHFLSQVSQTHAVDPARCQWLIEGAVKWLMTQQRPSGSRSWISPQILPGSHSSNNHLAWCCGDLGILAVLLQVTHRALRNEWRQFAHNLLDHCLDWPPKDTGIVDAPLCHGAAGVAHVFNRIYHLEGDPRCRDAAISWFRRTLGMRKAGAAAGGFLALAKEDQWEESSAFLDGATGVALALLAAVSPLEPAWDRMMLLSTPSVGLPFCRQL